MQAPAFARKCLAARKAWPRDYFDRHCRLRTAERSGDHRHFDRGKRDRPRSPGQQGAGTQVAAARRGVAVVVSKLVVRRGPET